MKHTYAISGLTCGGCAAKVKGLLSGIDGVTGVVIDLGKGEAQVEMTGHVGTEVLKGALAGYPKYQLSEVTATVAGSEVTAAPGGVAAAAVVAAPVIGRGEADGQVIVGGEADGQVIERAEVDAPVSWWVTYKPILLLFGYITMVALIGATASGSWKTGVAMRIFMSGFFLSFSFFKLLNLRAFAESYAMYDIVARRWAAWGYIYAFIELGLGVLFAVNVFPFYTNLVTLFVMSVSIVGVLQSVLNKKRIKCACLGAVFNLPMSTVTIIEDALMIGMSAVAIFATML